MGEGGTNGAPGVLFLTQVLPYPLDSGPKVRAYHVLVWLARRTNVHLVSFVRADDPPEAVEHLRNLCASVVLVPMRRGLLRDAWHLMWALLRGESFIIARDRSAAMSAAVRRAAADHTVVAVHADQLWMAEHAMGAQGGARLVRVLDDHNAVFLVFKRLAEHASSPLRRMLLRREARKLAAYEAQQLGRFDHVVFVSEEDRRAVMGAVSAPSNPTAATHVVPICLHLGDSKALDVVARPWRVTVLGTMFWPPNAEGVLWLADHVWPLVLAKAPHAVLTVVGKNPPDAVGRLSRRYGASVHVAGYVNDPEPILRETAVFAVPLLSGGGMRVKILEAWRWGLPIVSTTVGAEGIAATDGIDITLADEPRAFAEATIHLLGDPMARERLARGGREALAQRYDVARVYEKWSDVYGQVYRSRG